MFTYTCNITKTMYSWTVEHLPSNSVQDLVLTNSYSSIWSSHVPTGKGVSKCRVFNVSSFQWNGMQKRLISTSTAWLLNNKPPVVNNSHTFSKRFQHNWLKKASKSHFTHLTWNRNHGEKMLHTLQACLQGSDYNNSVDPVYWYYHANANMSKLVHLVCGYLLSCSWHL